jgi:SAM-dependent methyltransferase
MLASDDLERSLSGSFDAITLMDVFEHLSEPTGLLEKLARLLKPGGLLIIVTGNGDSQVCRRDPAQFWYFRNVEHLSMFTRSYAEMLAVKIDATITCWEQVSHYKMTPLVWVRQYIQDFAYWQFRSKNVISRLVLQQIPVLKRAKHWPVAPALTVTCDHVVAVFSPSRQVIKQ